jgi:hypothetical protein
MPKPVVNRGPARAGRYVLLLIAGAVLHASGLAFTAPDAWRKVPPSSSMRVAEFSLPRASGDTEDAELVLYYFGGQGGSVDANVQRWVAQMQQPDGRASTDVAKKTTRKVGGLDVTLLDLTGTYVAEMAPGAADHHNKPGFRLRAAVIETARGPYYIKLTGPQRTVSKWDASFERFVASLKYER